MNKIFVWGTLTTQVNGVGRTIFNKEKHEDIPLGTIEIQGIKGEVYAVSDETLAKLDDFEGYYGYIKTKISYPKGELILYVKSPTYDKHYWENYVRKMGV